MRPGTRVRISDESPTSCAGYKGTVKKSWGAAFMSSQVQLDIDASFVTLPDVYLVITADQTPLMDNNEQKASVVDKGILGSLIVTYGNVQLEVTGYADRVEVKSVYNTFSMDMNSAKIVADALANMLNRESVNT